MGLPLRCLPLACFCFFFWRAPPPPMPGIPGMPGMPPPWAMRDIILRASKKRSMRFFTALTSTPEPRAIRARREPLMMWGSWRSPGVIDLMIAAVRSTSRSSRLLIWSFICPMPGSIPSSFEMEPILRTCSICARKSSSVNSLGPFASLAAIFSASACEKVCSAFSIRLSMSPMPRMREAMRSGWNASKSSSFSPLEANMICRPVTCAIDRAAPPRASPSSLESTTPSKPTPSRNASAVLTASWPIIASTTNRISSGLTASRMSAACCISSASMPSRPAVSTITTSCCLPRANSTESFATCTGSPTPLPGSGAKTATSARSATTDSWFTALGRWRSQATSSGAWPWDLSQRPSFPASVVLPDPWRPASMMTVGGFLANRSRRVSPPRIPTSSSLTILMTCWAGFSACETSVPVARSFTCLMKARTTGSATSASSRAIRISRAVASMSASDRRPLPRRFLNVAARRSERVSNTVVANPSVGSGGGGRPPRVSARKSAIPGRRSPPCRTGPAARGRQALGPGFRGQACTARSTVRARAAASPSGSGAPPASVT